MPNSNNRQGVNPLRPYYVPPTIGEPIHEPSNIPGPTAFSRPSNGTTSGSVGGGPSSAKYASKARDIFSDLDYKDYISDSSPSVAENVQGVINELMWKYTSVFLAQPFEVAKLILQVRAQDDVGALGAPPVAAVAPSPAVSRQSSYKAASSYDNVCVLQQVWWKDVRNTNLGNNTKI